MSSENLSFVSKMENRFRKAELIAQEVLVLDSDDPIASLAPVVADTQKVRMFRAGLEVAFKLAPEKLKDKLRTPPFAKVPLNMKIGERGYRVMEYVGNGAKSATYLLEAKDSGAEVDYAIGFLFPGRTSTMEEAYRYAQNRKQDYERIKALYGHIPDFVPEEQYAVYENKLREPSVMYVREFVHGKRKDVFSYLRNPSELVSLVKTQKLLKEQLAEFIKVSLANEDLLVQEHLDLIGVNNLAVIEREGKYSLVLQDPHTRFVPKKGPRESSDIRNRIYMLREVLRKSEEEEASDK